MKVRDTKTLGDYIVVQGGTFYTEGRYTLLYDSLFWCCPYLYWSLGLCCSSFNKTSKRCRQVGASCKKTDKAYPRFVEEKIEQMKKPLNNFWLSC